MNLSLSPGVRNATLGKIIALNDDILADRVFRAYCCALQLSQKTHTPEDCDRAEQLWAEFLKLFLPDPTDRAAVPPPTVGRCR